MRRPPPLSRALNFPATAGTAIMALGITALWWCKVDISPLLPDALLAHGQIWRLLTCILPHRDPLHLAFNLYWLWTFGTLLEEHIGPVKMFGLIAALALGSGAAEFALLDGGVGLSGVGYGLFGLLWVLGRRDERYAGAVDERTVHLFAGWFFL